MSQAPNSHGDAVVRPGKQAAPEKGVGQAGGSAEADKIARALVSVLKTLASALLVLAIVFPLASTWIEDEKYRPNPAWVSVALASAALVWWWAVRVATQLGRRKDIRFPAPPVLDWSTEATTGKSLDALFDHCIARGTDATSWYTTAKAADRSWARAVRMTAIVLVAVGGIVPMLAEMSGKDGGTAWRVPAGFSAVAFAVAGMLVILDRFFGYSSAWMRYVLTEAKIQTMLETFSITWQMDRSAWIAAMQARKQRETAALALAQAAPSGTDAASPTAQPATSALPDAASASTMSPRSDPAPDRAEELLASLMKQANEFLIRLRQVIEAETATWADEFKSALSEIDKKMKEDTDAFRKEIREKLAASDEKAEASRQAAASGSIAVEVENGDKCAGGWTLAVGDKPLGVKMGRRAVVTDVKPGQYRVAVAGVIAQQPVFDEGGVEVKPATFTPLKLSLLSSKPPE